jgi:hypothetical protein
MSQSSLNSFNGVLASGASFTGKREVINGSISIVCFLESTQNIEIQIFQSKDGITFINTDIIVVDTLFSGPQTRTQFYTKLQWGYVKITNISGLSSTVLLSTLFTPNNHDGTPTQPTYVNIVNSSLAPIPITGSVEVSARSGTGFLSYLTDNVAVATMPAITGSVSITSQPPLSYLTDNVAVATMPAITGTVSLTNSLNTATYNSGPILVGGYTSPSFDLNENSLFDCLLFATGVIIAGNLRLDYSVDNINWIPNNTTSALAPLSTTDPHFVYLGVKSGSRYIRISTGAGSTFSATTNLQIIFSSKRN